MRGKKDISADIFILDIGKGTKFPICPKNTTYYMNPNPNFPKKRKLTVLITKHTISSD